MTTIQSILLGIIQGIAEFLPISSSGHLKVAQTLFGLDDVPLLFDVFLHLATLLAVFIYFRQKIWKLLCVLVRWITRKEADENEKDERKFIIAIILTTFVTGVLGILSSKLIPELNIKFVFAGFLITALALFVSSRLKNTSEEKAPNAIQALIIGLAQGIGTLPGISRSGSTIAGALFCKVNRKVAGEYSFIASIPAILGAFILEAKDLGEVSSSIGIHSVIIGCIAAFIAGYASLSLLMKVIKKGKLEYFAFYLIPVAILGLLFIK